MPLGRVMTAVLQEGTRTLNLAVELGNVEAVGWFLEAGLAPPEAVQAGLHTATAMRKDKLCPAIFKLLVAAGADVNQTEEVAMGATKTIESCTPLMRVSFRTASQPLYYDLVKQALGTLLDLNADVDCQNMVWPRVGVACECVQRGKNLLDCAYESSRHLVLIGP